MIVCDTNIWYDLGSGKISEQAISGKELACTHLTLNELHHTRNLLSNYQAVRNAVGAIKKFAKRCYWSNPFEFSISKLSPGYNPKTDNGIQLWRRLQRVLCVDLKIPAEEINAAEMFFIESKKDFEEFMKAMNHDIEIVRKNIRRLKLKELRRKEDDIEKAKKYFCRILCDYLSENDTKDIDFVGSQHWATLELFILVLSDYFKEIELSATQKLHGNDWADLLNLTYIGEGDFYWTSEKKWIRLIENNSVAAKYLFHSHLSFT